MPATSIYTEDSYGVGFFSLLIRDLKKDGLIENSVRYKIKRIPGRCSSKFTRIMSFEVELFSKILVNVDGDGDIEHAHDAEQKHIPKGFEETVYYIINKDEIEEWILFAKNVRYSGKPSKAMSQLIGRIYEKNMLPQMLKSVLNNPSEKVRFQQYEKYIEFLDALTS